MEKVGRAPLVTPTSTFLGWGSEESSGLVRDLAHKLSYSSKIPSPDNILTLDWLWMDVRLFHCWDIISIIMIKAWLVIPKNWKLPQYPPTRMEKEDVVYSHTECSTAVKRNKVDPCGLDMAKSPTRTLPSEQKQRSCHYISWGITYVIPPKVLSVATYCT